PITVPSYISTPRTTSATYTLSLHDALPIFGQGRDRATGRRQRVLRQPGSRALAPVARVLLPAGRRAAARHGAVLPELADHAAGTGGAGDRTGLAVPGRTRRGQRAEEGDDVPRRGGDARRGRPRAPVRSAEHDRDQFRRVGEPLAAHRD